jgi:hypothetical protein
MGHSKIGSFNVRQNAGMMLRVSIAIARLAIAVAFVSAACVHVHAADGPAGKSNTSKRASPRANTSASSAPVSAVAGTTSLDSAAFVSRELVDVEFQADQSLAILLSVPGTVAPGLYRWDLNDVQPRKLCDINAPSFFSFDRNVIIERERGASSRVRLYSPSDCRLLTTIDIAGNVLDVDVRDRYLAAAVRLAEKQIALQLFSLDGQLLSTTGIGRNVEMGFAPDGAMLVNFDLSDVGLQAWRVPRLTNILLPHWLHDAHVTFVPGSRYVKRYRDDTLSIARWPIGTPVHTMPASRTLRLRQLSIDGRYGVAHELVRGAEELQWIDFKDHVRTVLARGSIDNAAMSRDLRHAAWSLRLQGSEQRVLVQRRLAPPSVAPEAGDFAVAAVTAAAGEDASSEPQPPSAAAATATAANTSESSATPPQAAANAQIADPPSRTEKKRRSRPESE